MINNYMIIRQHWFPTLLERRDQTAARLSALPHSPQCSGETFLLVASVQDMLVGVKKGKAFRNIFSNPKNLQFPQYCARPACIPSPPCHSPPLLVLSR